MAAGRAGAYTGAWPCECTHGFLPLACGRTIIAGSEPAGSGPAGSAPRAALPAVGKFSGMQAVCRMHRDWHHHKGVMAKSDDVRSIEEDLRIFVQVMCKLITMVRARRGCRRAENVCMCVSDNARILEGLQRDGNMQRDECSWRGRGRRRHKGRIRAGRHQICEDLPANRDHTYGRDHYGLVTKGRAARGACQRWVQHLFGTTWERDHARASSRECLDGLHRHEEPHALDHRHVWDHCWPVTQIRAASGTDLE